MRPRLAAFFNPPRAPGDVRAPLQVFWVAFLVRLLYMTAARLWRIRPFQDHFTFGYEAGRIARALSTGYGYADPFSNVFQAHTGPTAWLPPAYPLLIAGVFRLFGVYTPLSAWVLLAINCALSAVTAALLWELGTRFAGLRVGLWAAWLWALYPGAMQYAVKWIWEMTLTTALFTGVLVLSFRMRANPDLHRIARWLWFGLFWGLIALSNSTLLLFLPVCALWILLRTPRPRLRWTGPVLAAMLFLAVVAPWTYRNYRVFGLFIPLRGNFGAELMLGNGPGANGLLMEYNHPFQSPEQLALYKSMGEPRYVRMRGAEAKAAIADDPAHFLLDTLKRIDFFWFSVPHPYDEGRVNELVRVLQFSFVSVAGLLGLLLALQRRMAGAGLFFWAFLLLPLPYYVVTVHARFRHPLEPLIAVLGVFLFQSAGSRLALRPEPRYTS